MTGTEFLYNLASIQAYGLSRRFPGIDRDDIRQECILAALEDGDFVWPEGLDQEERDRVERILGKRMRRAGEKYCRREKAALAGYDVADEAFYGINELRELVSAYFTDGITERPPIGRETSVRRTGDPSERGGWTVALMDVQHGLTAIQEHYVKRLYDHLHRHGHKPDSDAAYAMGLTEDQLRTRTRTALRALQRALGGQSPWTGRKASRSPSGAVSV